MSSPSRAVRTDDGGGLFFRTTTVFESAETRHQQVISLADADDGVFLDIVGEAALPKGLTIYGWDGTVSRAIRTTTGGLLSTEITQYAAGAITEVQGDVAHDIAVTGNPVLIGGRASDAVPTAVSADGDNVWAWRDRRGAAKMVVVDDAGDSIMDGANNAVRVTFAAQVGSIDTEMPAAAALGDAASATPTTPTLGAISLLMNATTVDRQRAVVAGLDSVGTGIAAMGMVGQFDDATPAAVTENQFAPVRISTRRALLVEGVASGTSVNVAVAAALPTGANNIGDVDILTIAAGDNNIGNVDIVTLPALVAGSANIGDVDVLTVPADPFGLNVDAASATGSISAKLRFIAATGIPITSLPASTNTLEVVGDAAHDAAVAGNPLLLGGTSSAAAPTDVSADAEVVRLWALRNGALAINVTAAGALIAGDAANGLDIDVTRLPALVAGTANIGDVDVLTIAAGDNNIGNVDIVTLPASTNTLEVVGDAAHDATVAGNPLLTAGRSSDAIPTAVSADGEVVYAWRDRRGAAKHVMVDDAGDSAMDGTNNALRVNVVAGGAAGGTSTTDDSAFTAGSGAGTPMMGFATSDVVDAGDVGVLRMTTTRDLHVTLRDSVGDSAMDDANNALRVNVVAGSGAGVTHTDDAAFTVATDDGVPFFGFFNDSTPDSVNEGDAGAVRMSANRNLYSTIRDSGGNERGVNVNASNQLAVSVDNTVTVAAHNVTNAGTFVVQENGAALTALQLIDNVVHTEDEASADGHSGVLILARRTATPANTSGLDLDYETLQLSAGRLWTSATIDTAIPAGDNNIGNVDIVTVPAPLSTTGGGTEATALRVTIANDSTGLVSIDDNAGSITIDGSVSITGAVDTELPTAAALADNTANPTVPGVGAFGMVWDGANWDRSPGTTADGTLVDLGANNDVTVTSGSITADTELPAAAALADNTANPTVPGVGAFGLVWDGANWDRAPGTTADGTLVNLGTNNDVQGQGAHDVAVTGNPVVVGGVGETAADSAPSTRASTDGDAVRVATDLDGALYVLPHGPQVWSYHENSSSTLTDAVVHATPGGGLSLYVTDIIVSTGAATDLNVFFEEGASTVLGPYYLEAVLGRGLHIQFRTPKKITANTALTISTSGAVAHGIDVTGYIAPG